MNTMNIIPGFTANASLYKTSGHYRTAGTPNDLVGNREILPQLPIGFCMANCDRIQDDFMRTVCNVGCFDQGGGGGGGGIPEPVCRPSCSSCRRVPGLSGRWRTCITRNCDDYERSCP